MSGPWLCLQSCFLPRGRPSGPGETSAPLPASLRPAPLSPPPPWPWLPPPFPRPLSAFRARLAGRAFPLYYLRALN